MSNFRKCNSVVEAVTKATLRGVSSILDYERGFGKPAPDIYYKSVNQWNMYLTGSKKHNFKELREL